MIAAAGGVVAPMAAAAQDDAQVWRRYEVSFESAAFAETPSTFTDFRLNVAFTHAQTQRTILVPGFFAADGNAAETGATDGGVWKARFNPPMAGAWTYVASFREGADVAASLQPNAGTPTGFDGASGAFTAAPASDDPADGPFRTKGMVLQAPGSHYLRHAGDNSVWIKTGVGSPENFLAYREFDGTFDTGGIAVDLPDGLHTYAPHRGDWRLGDPTWRGGQGDEIIGAVNYLSSEGVNSFYFVSMNVRGDGRDVWPWTGPDSRLTYDVSKLAQWEIVFEHMDDLGMALNIYTQETENDQLLNGGDLGLERRIYYREMIARFGHHNGLFWNLGEENTNTAGQIREFADYITALDPYGHLIAMHTFPGDKQRYAPLLGFAPFDGAALQSGTGSIRNDVAEWVRRSREAGDPWVATWDESGPASTGVQADGRSGAADNHKRHRDSLWGVLTAGGSGSDWYFGYQTGQGDVNLEDFRSRDTVWDWTRLAGDFFETQNLPLDNMRQNDGLTTDNRDFVFAAPGDAYVVYRPNGGGTSLNLSNAIRRFFGRLVRPFEWRRITSWFSDVDCWRRISRPRRAALGAGSRMGDPRQPQRRNPAA